MVYSYEGRSLPTHWYGYDIKQRLLVLLTEFLNAIKFSSLILALTGGAGIYASCFIQGIPCTPALVVIMVLVSFSVYNLNRKTDEKEDEINHKERFLFTKKFEKHLFYAALASYAIALGICSFLGPSALLVGLIPLVSGILYSVPLLPKTWHFHRLKEIPLMKNLLVAGAWALTLSLLPVYANSLLLGIPVLLTGLFFFNYVFMASVLPDIRDREGDAQVGVYTIPVILGVRKTEALLTGVTLLIGCGILFFGTRYLPIPVLVLLGAGLCYIQFCILSMGRVLDTNFVCDVLADGGFIIIGATAAVIPFISGFA
jgi:4-hydroxybenzoate polyprenyltransferase